MHEHNLFVDDMLSYVRKALDKITGHINTMESQLKTERRRWKKPGLYKTELCEHWRNKRKCMFGLKCWYAHGPQDLRPNSGSSSAMSCTTTGISGDEASGQSMSSGGMETHEMTLREIIMRDTPASTPAVQLPAVDATADSTSQAEVSDPQAPPTSISYAAMCAGGMPPPIAYGAPQQHSDMRPTFLVSFDNRIPFAAAPPPLMPLGALNAAPVPTTAAIPPTSTGGELPALKPDLNYPQQHLLGFDFFRSNNLHFNFGSSAGLNLGMSGFGFAAPPPAAFASSDNWMGALASSFIIPSKNIWLHQSPQ